MRDQENPNEKPGKVTHEFRYLEKKESEFEYYLRNSTQVRNAHGLKKNQDGSFTVSDLSACEKQDEWKKIIMRKLLIDK